MKIDQEDTYKYNLPVYVIMISFQRKDFAIKIINDYLSCNKPKTKTNFIIVENNYPFELEKSFDFSLHQDLTYVKYANKNKAAALNYAIKNNILEESLIICIDNDIEFKPDFVLKYYQAAVNQGSNFYFGSSFYVNKPKSYDRALSPYLSGSAVGMPDGQFKKMNKLMFLGFSFSFFKSQWVRVKGFDERFSPGSKFNLHGQESLFQKKLVHAGFLPYFVENNEVEHKTLPELYTFHSVRDRHENNGYTHGFQNLIISNQPFKINCIRRLLYLFKRCFVLLFQKDKMKFEMKYAYTKGFLKAFILYFKIDDRSSYLDY